jgi:two-component system chemotaxis sensor kinase CheA
MMAGETPGKLPSDVLEAIKVVFFQECEELVAELETSLLALQSGDADPETINAAFRAAHSIKGSAGTFGFEALVRFAHVFENALDRLRGGAAPPGVDANRMLLRATDTIADLIRAARDGVEVDEGRHRELVDDLAAFAAGAAGASARAEADDLDDFDFTPVAVDLAALDLDAQDSAPADPAAPDGAAVAPGRWRISFRPQRGLYARANEPLLILRELARLGDVSVALDERDLPGLPGLDPEGAYLAWTVDLVGDVDEAGLREVFEFVEDDCDLEIVPLADAERAVEPEAAVAAEPPAPPPPAEPAPPAAQGGASPAPAAATIRVDLERVDRLMDLVGELIINHAALDQEMTRAGLPRTAASRSVIDDLEQLSRELQRSVMAIRAQPVKTVFQRMSRLVREVEVATGKQVAFVTEGEHTEVDRTVIERLTDPITHMIRNAVDHGVEPAEVRIAAGKPARGTLRLSARHRSGQVVIELADDGGGVNRARVHQVAVERGLIAPDAELTEAEIDNLIFLPGFSTAETVSDLSGRGVGLDVVRRSVAALGGRIAIASVPGEGSTVTLSLPLTLAVMDGMVVKVAGQTLAIPLTAVVQTLQARAEDVRAFGADACLIRFGEGHIPLIDVGAALGYGGAAADAPRRVAIVVEGETGKAALLVDEIQDQRQVVIKSLEANYRTVEGVSAATILGDGRVALILDIDAVLARSGAAGRRAQSRAATEALCA